MAPGPLAGPVPASAAAAITAGGATNGTPRMHNRSAAPPNVTRTPPAPPGAATRSPSPPASAAANAMCIGGLTQAICGRMRARRLTTNDPIPPSSPRHASQWNAARTRSGCGDDPPAQDSAARVQHRGLTGRGAQEGFLEREASSLVDRADGGRVVAQARLARERFRGGAINEGHALEDDVPDAKLFAATDDDAVLARDYSKYVPRSWLGEGAESAALSHRIQGGASMRSQRAPAAIDDWAAADWQPRRQIAGGLAARDEADLLALGFVGDGQAELAGVLADLTLGHAAEREQDAPEPLAVQVIEHVRLVLRVVDGGVQLGATGTLHDPRVVAGGQPVESELEHAREHEVEAHERIASHAGIRGAALEVGAVERLDDPFPELALQVPAVIRNVEDRGDTARVLHRRQRTASAVARGLIGVIARPLLQGHAHHVMALRLEQRCGDRRVDATGHRDRDPHLLFSTMCRATSSASSATP